MSGINSISGSGLPTSRIEQAPTVQPGSAPVGNPSLGTSIAPDVQASVFQPTSLSALGLSNPVNAEDFVVLLSEIEDKLDKAMKEARNAKVISLAQGIRSVLSGLISRSNAMAAMGQQMCDCQARIDDNSSRRNTFHQDQLQASVEASTLGPRVNAARDKYEALNNALQKLDPKSPHYKEAQQARDGALALLNELQARKAAADLRSDSSGQNLARTDQQIASDRASLVALASQYSTLQLMFMTAFGELARLFGRHSESAHSDQLVEQASSLRVEDLNDLVKAFGERRAVLELDSLEHRQDRLRTSEHDRVEGAVALVVSAITEILTALADITPAGTESDEPDVDPSNSMMFRG